MCFVKILAFRFRRAARRNESRPSRDFRPVYLLLVISGQFTCLNASTFDKKRKSKENGTQATVTLVKRRRGWVKIQELNLKSGAQAKSKIERVKNNLKISEI